MLQWEEFHTGGNCMALAARNGSTFFVITCPDDPCIPEPGEPAYLGIYPDYDSWGEDNSLHGATYESTEAAKAFAETFAVPAPVVGSVGEYFQNSDLSRRWLEHVNGKLLRECTADSPCGRAIVKICDAGSVLLDALGDGSEFGESGDVSDYSARDRVIAGVTLQIEIIYFG